MTNATYDPTPEQQAAIDAFHAGGSLVVEAGAGTGKTSTLRFIGASTPQRGQFIAFNKAIVNDAAAVMPGNVACSTAHSLAYRAVGKTYGARLRSSARMKSMEIARRLQINPLTIRYGTETRVLSSGYLAGLTMRAVTLFCQSADLAPGPGHVPYIDGIDAPRDNGSRTYDNNREVAKWIAPAMRRAWDDIQNVQGVLPFKHEHYLKIWQLSNPIIPADFILFDEAQDASPVLLAVVEAQAHAQLVFVGDSNQAIYGFTGAVDALAKVNAERRTRLSQSFRFGQPVAEVANDLLALIGSDMRLLGSPLISSVVGPVAEPDAILTRTNAGAMTTVFRLIKEGHRPHLVGGGTELVSFARAAADLMDGRTTMHPELACFSDWADVQEYVANDEQGGDLRLMVKLVDDFGPEAILSALGGMPSESAATIIVSTAHKSKGRQWGSVQLAGDFPEPKDNQPVPSLDELRLLYVAVTRARYELDIEAVKLLIDSREAPETDERTPVGLITCVVCEESFSPLLVGDDTMCGACWQLDQETAPVKA